MEELSKVRKSQDGDIVVHGSGQLVRTLLAHDLGDELRPMVVPVVIGSGKRLFGGSSEIEALERKDSRTVGDGVVIVTYQAAGNSTKPE